MGHTLEGMRDQFGALLDALEYGAPPHGGIAIGVERWVALLANQDNIREVTAFPKTQSGSDLMLGAPSPLDPQQLADLHLRLELDGAAPAAAATPQGKALPISDANLKALTSTMGGAQALPTSRTVAHWWGSSLDPHNGVTYGYNMVGANPNTCSGSACNVTIQ